MWFGGIAQTTADSVKRVMDPIGYSTRDLRRKGCKCDGATDDLTALTAAAAEDVLFPANKTVVISGDVTLTGSVHFETGAKIKPAAGKYLKITGQLSGDLLSILDAGSGGNVIVTSDPQYSYADLTLNVVAAPAAPNEFADLQSAVDAVPRFISHVITVNVGAGTYPKLDLYDKQLVVDSPAEFFITGDTVTPANVVVQGAALHALRGYLFPKISGVRFAGGLGESGGDECVVFVIHCDSPEIKQCEVDGIGAGAGGADAQAGILAYSGRVNLTNVGKIDNCVSPLWTKHGGRIQVTSGAIPSAGATYPYQTSTGKYDTIKQIAYADPSAAISDQINAEKSRSGEFAFDQFMAHIAGPGYFLSSAAKFETLFEAIAGYTNNSGGGGTVATGANGLAIATGGGTVDFSLQRSVLSAPNAYRRPIFVTFCVDVTALPVGETLYIGVGQPYAAGDFLGFKLTGSAVDGAVRLVGTESTVQVAAAAAAGARRFGLLYSPATTDTSVEAAPTNYVTFYDFDGNTCTRLVMAGDFSDPSMQRRFAVYCAQVGAVVQAAIPHYKYVQA